MASSRGPPKSLRRRARRPQLKGGQLDGNNFLSRPAHQALKAAGWRPGLCREHATRWHTGVGSLVVPIRCLKLA
jgi:hypothetical protein